VDGRIRRGDRAAVARERRLRGSTPETQAPVGESGEAIAPLDELGRVHGRTVLIADEVRTIQATGHLKSVHQSAEVIKDTDQSARLS